MLIFSVIESSEEWHKHGVPAIADTGVDAELEALGMMGTPSALTPERLADVNKAAEAMGLPTRTDENG